MNEGESWDALPEDLLVDCAQLTKANSIEGQHSLSSNLSKRDAESLKETRKIM